MSLCCFNVAQPRKSNNVRFFQISNNNIQSNKIHYILPDILYYNISLNTPTCFDPYCNLIIENALSEQYKNFQIFCLLRALVPADNLRIFLVRTQETGHGHFLPHSVQLLFEITLLFKST
jgi:hypothetical protein